MGISSFVSNALSKAKYSFTAVSLNPAQSMAVTTGALTPTVAYPSIKPGIYNYDLSANSPPHAADVGLTTADLNTFPSF